MTVFSGVIQYAAHYNCMHDDDVVGQTSCDDVGSRRDVDDGDIPAPPGRQGVGSLAAAEVAEVRGQRRPHASVSGGPHVRPPASSRVESVEVSERVSSE